MTLCLSGFCNGSNSIAYVLDEQLTTLESSADVVSKVARINPTWLLSFCGDHIGQVGAVYDKVKRKLLQAGPQAVGDVQKEITAAQYRTFIEEDVPATLPAGWEYDEFKREGRQRLGDSEYSRIETLLNTSRWGYDLLLSGFDNRGVGHIVELAAQRPADHCRWAFMAMGSGREIAEHFLKFVGYTPALSEVEAAFYLAAAKFYAESGYIGKGTRIGVLRRDGTLWSLPYEPVRDLWWDAKPSIPANLKERMPQLVEGASMQFSAQRRTPVDSRVPQSPTGDSPTQLPSPE